MKQIKTLGSKVIHRFKFGSVTAKGSKNHHLSAVSMRTCAFDWAICSANCKQDWKEHRMSSHKLVMISLCLS